MKLRSIRKYIAVTFVLCVGLFFTSFTQTAEASNINVQQRQQRKPKQREYDKIVSVDAAANSVTIYDHVSKKEVVYKVTKFTKVTIDGKASELKQLEKDMNVEITGSASLVSKLDANTKSDSKDK